MLILNFNNSIPIIYFFFGFLFFYLIKYFINFKILPRISLINLNRTFL